MALVALAATVEPVNGKADDAASRPHLGFAAKDDADLAEIARRAALDERHVGGQTEPVDVTPRVEIVERVHDERKLTKVLDAEARRFHIAVNGVDVRALVERHHGGGRNLCAHDE